MALPMIRALLNLCIIPKHLSGFLASVNPYPLTLFSATLMRTGRREVHVGAGAEVINRGAEEYSYAVDPPPTFEELASSPSPAAASTCMSITFMTASYRLTLGKARRISASQIFSFLPHRQEPSLSPDRLGNLIYACWLTRLLCPNSLARNGVGLGKSGERDEMATFKVCPCSFSVFPMLIFFDGFMQYPGTAPLLQRRHSSNNMYTLNL
jgi:hypothetical protein